MKNSAIKGIVMATRLEAAPFIESGLFTCIEEKPMPVYQNETVYLILSGIGKASAAIAATYLITKYKTEIMYNIGAAGSTTEDFGLGDILHIDSVIDYDRPALIGSKPRYLKPEVLADYKTATLATQDVAVVSSEEREKVGKLASLVDMEGAAFVQACRTFKIKNYLFKIVTDTPSHIADKQIIENIKNTRDLLYRFFVREFLS
ncbi:MAG TPA: hypothetical protein PKG60_09780 [Spirochaetota bacterium]|nr:hypothetical protein [Spirochaetota bacterium]